jgi:hypothetical protein
VKKFWQWFLDFVKAVRGNAKDVAHARAHPTELKDK